MGSKKSSSASSTTTNTQDNSAVAGSGAVALAAGANYSALDWFQSADQYLTDLSDNSQSSTSTVQVGTDAGAVRLGEVNAQLLGAVAESQTDAVRFMTSAGAQVLQNMGASVTDLYGRAGSNNAESWGATVAANERLLSGAAARMGAAWADTIDRSADLIGGISAQASRTVDTAGQVAQSAITSFQPTDNAQAGALKWGLIAAAGIAALLLLPRLRG